MWLIDLVRISKHITIINILQSLRFTYTHLFLADHCHPNVDKSYCPFFMATNKSYSVKKKICSQNTWDILNRICRRPFKLPVQLRHFSHITKCNLIGCPGISGSCNQWLNQTRVDECNKRVGHLASKDEKQTFCKNYNICIIQLFMYSILFFSKNNSGKALQVP